MSEPNQHQIRHAEFLNTCQTTRSFYKMPFLINQFACVHVYSISQCCSHPFSRKEFSQPTLRCIRIPPWGQHTKKAVHTPISVSGTTTSEESTNSEVTNKYSQEASLTSLSRNLNKCDAFTKNRLRPPACRAKKKAAALCNHSSSFQTCLVLFSFLVYALGYIDIWFSFYLYPGEPS